LRELSREETDRIAPTHKASNLIDGQTIHSYLSLGLNASDSKLSSSTITYITRTQPLILIDEISTIDENIWFLLCEVKRLTGCIFILFGDHRQLTPVMGGYYFDHPCVVYLSGGNRAELTKIHRHDNKLLSVSDYVFENGKLPERDFGVNECRKPIAYHHVVLYDTKQILCGIKGRRPIILSKLMIGIFTKIYLSCA
jgi:ATP-dependent exoDNAse (exonuclease V) alpha subunit